MVQVLKIISDLVLKEINGKTENKLKDNETKKHRMTEREAFKRIDNSSENQLNGKSKDVLSEMR